MIEETTDPPIDKSTWGPGPWQDEPDRVEWRHAGLPCLAARSPGMGNWCGYAAVPPGHPLHRKGYPDDGVDLDVHGGLTYADVCRDHICHVPHPGEPDDVWWFGFDCGHWFDVMPALAARMRGDGLPDLGDLPQASYKTLDYVRGEVNRLAEQLAAFVGPGSPAPASPGDSVAVDPVDRSGQEGSTRA